MPIEYGIATRVNTKINICVTKTDSLGNSLLVLYKFSSKPCNTFSLSVVLSLASCNIDLGSVYCSLVEDRHK